MVYLMLAEGFEEVEALTPLDYLRRSGLEVCCVGVGSDFINGAHKIKVQCDIDFKDCKFDLEGSMIILPGGLKGTQNLFSNEQVLNILKQTNKLGSIAAICAAPAILGRLDLLIGKKACCYPGFEKFLKGAEVLNEKVVVCENIITSKGAGTAQQFSFEIIRYLIDEIACEKLKNEVQWN